MSAFYESGSRFSALRQFRVLTCDAASGQSCDDPAAFAQVYLSPADAFPGDGMRPTAPDLNARSFAVPRTMATHVLGHDISIPVIMSPTGVQAVHPDGELAVARAAANAGILGARGNCGMILSHWLIGLAEGLRDRRRARVVDVARALRNASDHLYRSIEKPVEGTMLTVMRETAEEAAIWGGTAGQSYDPCYHSACDTIDNPNREALGVNADAIAFSVLSLAYSTETVNGVKGKMVPGSPALNLPTEPAGPAGTVGSGGGGGLHDDHHEDGLDDRPTPTPQHRDVVAQIERVRGLFFHA